MTNEFYKGMLQALKNARDYGEVVKANHENNKAAFTDPGMIAYENGAAAGVQKMIEYFNLFVDYLGVYDDDDKRNESN